jgi:hypothetical protein
MLLLISASPVTSSPLLVLTLARRSLHVNGRAVGRLVPAHIPRHCVLGPWRVSQVTGAFVLLKDRLQHYKTGAPSRAATYSLSLGAGLSSRADSELMWVCFCSASASRCCDAVFLPVPLQ